MKLKGLVIGALICYSVAAQAYDIESCLEVAQATEYVALHRDVGTVEVNAIEAVKARFTPDHQAATKLVKSIYNMPSITPDQLYILTLRTCIDALETVEQ